VLEQPAPGQGSALVERDLRERAIAVVESLCRELSGCARAAEDVEDDAPVVEGGGACHLVQETLERFEVEVLLLFELPVNEIH